MNNRTFRYSLIILFSAILPFLSYSQAQTNEFEASVLYVFTVDEADEPAEIKEIVQTFRDSPLILGCKYFENESFFKIESTRPLVLSEVEGMLGRSGYALSSEVLTSKGVRISDTRINSSTDKE